MNKELEQVKKLDRQIDELLKKNEKIGRRGEVIRDGGREIIIDRLNLEKDADFSTETKVIEKIDKIDNFEELESTKVIGVVDEKNCKEISRDIENLDDSSEILGMFYWILATLLIFLGGFFCYYIFFK